MNKKKKFCTVSLQFGTDHDVGSLFFFTTVLLPFWADGKMVVMKAFTDEDPESVWAAVSLADTQGVFLLPAVDELPYGVAFDLPNHSSESSLYFTPSSRNEPKPAYANSFLREN